MDKNEISRAIAAGRPLAKNAPYHYRPIRNVVQDGDRWSCEVRDGGWHKVSLTSSQIMCGTKALADKERRQRELQRRHERTEAAARAARMLRVHAPSARVPEGWGGRVDISADDALALVALLAPKGAE